MPPLVSADPSASRRSSIPIRRDLWTRLHAQWSGIRRPEPTEGGCARRYPVRFGGEKATAGVV